MGCPYTELANKIEVHLSLDETPGYYLSEADQTMIVRALRYASERDRLIDILDDIEVGPDGKCRWADVANAQNRIRLYQQFGET